MVFSHDPDCPFPFPALESLRELGKIERHAEKLPVLKAAIQKKSKIQHPSILAEINGQLRWMKCVSVDSSNRILVASPIGQSYNPNEEILVCDNDVWDWFYIYNCRLIHGHYLKKLKGIDIAYRIKLQFVAQICDETIRSGEVFEFFDAIGEGDLHTAHRMIERNPLLGKSNCQVAWRIGACTDFTKLDPLYYSLVSGHTPITMMLLDHGVEVDQPGCVGRRPLNVAAIQNRCEVLQRLLERGADIDALSDAGWTALADACRTGQSEAVIFLVEHGANVNILDENHYAPLHKTDDCSNKAFRAIASRTTSLDLINDNGDTPLLVAATNRDLPQMLRLLEAGADMCPKGISPGTLRQRIMENRKSSQNHKFIKAIEERFGPLK